MRTSAGVVATYAYGNKINLIMSSCVIKLSIILKHFFKPSKEERYSRVPWLSKGPKGNGDTQAAKRDCNAPPGYVGGRQI